MDIGAWKAKSMGSQRVEMTEETENTGMHSHPSPVELLQGGSGFYGVERSQGGRQSLWRMERSQWWGPCLWGGGTQLTAVLSLAHTLARGWMPDGAENSPGPRCPQEQGPT